MATRVPLLCLLATSLGCVSSPTISHEAERRIAELEVETEALRERIDILTRAVIELTGEKWVTSTICGAAIEAEVLDVKRDLKLVVLNKGTKDGVKIGYVFDVYHGSTYKGQVRIQDVSEGMSSGLILNELKPIARGDAATTSL